MERFVALLRGVNVGGVTLKMEAARRIFEEAGAVRVRSYLASGNLVFEAGEAFVERGTALGIEREIGRSIPVLVMGEEEYRDQIAGCPFADQDGRRVRGFFAFEDLSFDLEAAERLRASSEGLVVGDGVIWLYTPEGIGRSKLAERLERLAGGPLTGRNLNTIRALGEMLDG